MSVPAPADLREQLLDIIAEEGMISRDKLTADATLESLGVTSYDLVLVMMAIEEKFKVYISVSTELAEARTLDEFLAVLTRHIESGVSDAKPAPTP